MKWTILGFNQEEMIKANMDVCDAAILRYFIDFKDDGEMVTRIIDNKLFYWLKYSNLLSAMPCLKIKSKDALRRRLRKLVKAKILDSKCVKEKGKGTFSFYAVGSNYKNLIKKTYPSDLKVVGGATKKSDGCDLKVVPKDTSIKDTSIKDNIYSLVVTYLNKKTNKNYKHTTKKTQKLINARIAEGFTLEDFYKVIDNKTSEWTGKITKEGTPMENYLRPETLFGNKFEGYLNQKTGGAADNGSMQKLKYDNKKTKSTAGEERAEQYDLSDL
ncbi:conserved phage C-terminal domain-containing protein [Clostridium cochlearium]|uniref:conserved phage C-terminal domain-containing protein n=1 Tax=Clostridium cochlearium TaxID=1494 RepID=UPI000BBC4BF1|nr:conserved phage C-terminal domain-containing protein [Clostridium cochlearium]